MRIEYLKYFIEVVECGAISKASSKLFISPQGMSQAIQKLEQELEAALFYREGGRLTLTAAGETAYDMAKTIDVMVQKLYSAMGEYKKQDKHYGRKELCVFSAPMANTTYLPSVLTQMRRRYPTLRLSVYEVDPECMFERFEEMPGSILVLGLPDSEMGRFLDDSPRALNYYELFRTPIRASVSSKSPLAGRSVLTMSEFQKHPLVVYGVEDRILRMMGVEIDPDQVMLHTSSMSMCRSILAGEADGIGFTNAVEERYLKTNALVSIPLTPSVDMLQGYFIEPEQRDDPVIQDFIDLMKAELNGEKS